MIRIHNFFDVSEQIDKMDFSSIDFIMQNEFYTLVDKIKNKYWVETGHMLNDQKAYDIAFYLLIKIKDA
jgi:hypothetical protein